VAIFTYACEEEFNPACVFYFLFVGFAFTNQVRDGPIENIDLFRWDVNVCKEVFEPTLRQFCNDNVTKDMVHVHESMITLRMIKWQANVLIHVKRDDILE
jgi:hypothetical protein